MRTDQSDNLARTYKRAKYISTLIYIGELTAPLYILLVLYIFLVFLRLPQQLPDSLRLLTLTLLVGLILFFFIAGLRNIKKQSQRDFLRNIESSSHLPRGTLQAFTDHPAHIPFTSNNLWEYHKKRLLQSLPPLTIKLPQLKPYDVLLIVAALIFTSADILEYCQSYPLSSARILSGFVPNDDDPQTPLASTSYFIETPPWRGQVKQYYRKDVTTLKVPKYSLLHAEISALSTPPQLFVNGRPDREQYQIGKSGNNWNISTPIKQSTALTLYGRGRLLKKLHFTVIDPPPVLVKFSAPLQHVQGTLQTLFPVEASHPYGLKELTLMFRQSEAPQNTPPQFLPIAFAGHPTTIKKDIYFNLMPYSWADHRQEVQLCARTVSEDYTCSSKAILPPQLLPLTNKTSRALLRIRHDFSSQPEQGQQYASEIRHLVAQSSFISSHYGYLMNALYIAMLMDRHDNTEPVHSAYAHIKEIRELLWFLAADLQSHNISS